MFLGLQISGHGGQVNVGESVTLSCSFDLELVSLEWVHNNSIILSSAAPQINLTLSPVNDSIHNRQYSCRAVTSYGVQEQNVTILVKGTKILSMHYVCNILRRDNLHSLDGTGRGGPGFPLESPPSIN